jgi:hypothetical protein
MLVFTALERQRKEDCKFEYSLDIVSARLACYIV